MIVSAVALGGGVAGLAGIALGSTMMALPRFGRRRRPSANAEAGTTVAQLLQRAMSLAPVGMVVVDTLGNVVVFNDRAVELGLVRDRVLDDRVWAAAQRTLATGNDVEIDLSAPRGELAGRWGLSVQPGSASKPSGVRRQVWRSWDGRLGGIRAVPDSPVSSTTRNSNVGIRMPVARGLTGRPPPARPSPWRSGGAPRKRR